MSIALAAALVIGGAGAAHAQPRARADQPPFPYADCINAAKQNKESAAHAKWHCDELVKKGWIKKPMGNEGQLQKAQPQKPQAKKPQQPQKPQPQVKKAPPKKAAVHSPHAKRAHLKRLHAKKTHAQHPHTQHSHIRHPHT
ncbi:hypothetical protein ACH427_22470 [Streptomyces sp. NPDC020379]|uniref:hypothetical protein n=1 Tax=Streptomyces sp. NPDC020379 TaxID=3365071 RepID=UPI00379E0CD3